MSVASKHVTVGTTPTVIAGPAPSYNRVVTALLKNTGTSNVYLGGPDVTTADGFTFQAGASLTVELNSDDTLYGIVGSGSVDVSLMAIGDD